MATYPSHQAKRLPTPVYADHFACYPAVFAGAGVLSGTSPKPELALRHKLRFGPEKFPVNRALLMNLER
jgi:hypothetical protein